MPVEFVTIDGRAIPLHPLGGCSGKGGDAHGGAARVADGECIRTRCPKCNEQVFFIRHNGGSVYIDPPLGPPWLRHPCMPDQARKHVPEINAKISSVSPEASHMLGRVRGLITGVVIKAELVSGGKQAILTIAVAQTDPLVLLMRSPSFYFVGRMVILRPAKRALYSAEDPADVFLIDRALYVPSGLRSPEFPLLQEGASGTADPDDAKTRLKLDGETRGVAKAYRKFLAQGLSGPWQAQELASIIHLLDGRSQDDAVHLAAVLSLQKCIDHGDPNAALLLAKNLHSERRAKLASWFRMYSPLIIDLSRLDKKFWFVRDAEHKILPFNMEGARSNPVFRHSRNAKRR